MKICDLQSGLGQLTQAVSQLNARWGELKPQWQDDTGREFEAQYLLEIPGHLKMLMNAASRLAESLDKVARECDEPTEKW